MISLESLFGRVVMVQKTIPYISRRGAMCGVVAVGLATLLPAKTATAVAQEPLDFISTQVQEIERIIAASRYDLILTNRYLASCAYYSDHFCSTLASRANQVDVPTKILGRVCHLITPEFRRCAIEALETLTRGLEEHVSWSVSAGEHEPLPHFSFGHGWNHPDAVDLFTTEGTSALAFADGIVVVADAQWHPSDQCSSASMKGGNSVILFNYKKNEFYRYAHLRTVCTAPGRLVARGDALGAVGHTGKNASKPGHGGHLHFEINQHNRQAHTNLVVPAPVIHRRLAGLL